MMLDALSWPWTLIVLGVFALSSIIWAVAAFIWGRRHGQFRDFDRQARSIFDDYESEGAPTDFFPGKGPPPSEYLL